MSRGSQQRRWAAEGWDESKMERRYSSPIARRSVDGDGIDGEMDRRIMYHQIRARWASAAHRQCKARTGRFQLRRRAGSHPLCSTLLRSAA